MAVNGKDKAPAYQWYPKDWKSDSRVMRMTYAQRGIYRELMDTQWLEGSIASDPEQLAQMLGIPFASFEKQWPLIKECFTPRSDGRLVQMRLERQRQELAEYIRKQRVFGKRGAAKKWKKGHHAN